MKALKHLKTILKHKFWVAKYCFKAGIPIQGIFHDLSKFSPIEFFESVKYYQGNRSPIDACKEDKGYSMAWMHHKGRNPHHYEYWQDNFDKGGQALIMPYKYAVEMFCDYLGAGRAYSGKNFTYKGEKEWWKNKISNPIAMHPAIQNFISMCLDDLDYGDFEGTFKEMLQLNYKCAIDDFYELEQAAEEYLNEEEFFENLEKEDEFIGN